LTGGKAITIITTPVQAYIPPHGGTATEITSEFLARATMPFSGRVTELHVNFPQGSGDRPTTFTTYLKGSVTSQTCTAIENVGTCSDTNSDHAVSFKKGETISVYNSGVFIPQHSGVSLVVVPDEKDTLLSALSGSSKVSGTANRYQYFSTGSAVWNVTESNVPTLAQTGMLSKPAKILSMYVQADAIPSGGSYAITLRRNQTSTPFSCTISSMSMNPECEVWGALTIQDGDEYDIQVIPVGMVQIPPEPRGDGGDEFVEAAPSPIYINAGFKLNLKQRRNAIIN